MICKGKILDLDTPVVMGILNATPDSFYNKGRESSFTQLVQRAMTMIGDGALILDIGGQSSRPGARPISAKEETERILPLIKQINQMFPSTILSVDTFYCEVAAKALDAGADIINDISGGLLDPSMVDVALEYHAAYICMHMQGTPQTMQQQPEYDDVVSDIYYFFETRLDHFAKKGLDNVILDVGFGFGKTLAHNYRLLQQLHIFTQLTPAILVGLSRKSMVYKPIHGSADTALNGTTALHMSALEQGAKILRVHDVKEAKEVVTLHKFLHES